MALPTTERPPAPPPKPKLQPKAPPPADNAAAAYHARWGVPMPISAADDRRTSVASPPPPAAPAQVNRFDPNAVRTAQSILQEALAAASLTPEQHTAQGLSALYDNDPATSPLSDGSGRVGAYQQMAKQSGNEPTLPPPPIGVDKAEAQLASALRDQRKQGLGLNKPGETPVPMRKRVDRMTTDDYNALTPTQRAAVDFNGMLYTAVQRDKKLADDYMPSPTEKAQYDQTVVDMFGKDGGSKKFAPETVGVLAQIGYKDPSGDLDDYLKLKAAVREKDLKFLADTGGDPQYTPVTQFFGDPSLPTKQPTDLNDARLDRVNLARQIATNTQAMQAALVQGNQLLQSINVTARGARGESVDLLGGTASDVTTPLGYQPASFDSNGVPQDLNSYFQLAFDKIAQGDAKAFQGMKADVAANVISEQEFASFLAYADNRTRNANRYGVTLGETPGVTYRSPEEFRQLLGLDKKEADRAP